MLNRRDFNKVMTTTLFGGMMGEGSSIPAESAASSVEGPSAAKVQQKACGALLKDNFNSGRMDSTVWEAMDSVDPGIKVGFEKGELRIWGTSAPIPDGKLREDQSAMCRYAGLYSRVFSANDVSLACRVKMPSGISTEPGDHVAVVHLCGVMPDLYPEVLFGKFEGKITAEIMRNYYPNEFVTYEGCSDVRANVMNTTFQSARGWWLAIVGQDPGRPVYRVSGIPVPEQGDERTAFHDVLVEYDEPSRLARAYLKIGERWTQLGGAERVIRGLSRVELKLRDFSPLSGTYRDARFDDCRLYPNPRRNPVRIVLVLAWFN